MNFAPRTEEEIIQRQEEVKTMNLLPYGIYDFEVSDASDKISKTGNEMIELIVKVWDDNGKERFLYDYLVEKMEYKLKHFCEYNGLHDKYDMGTLNAKDCLRVSGKVEIGIQKGKPNPNGGMYPDKNFVIDYVSKEKSKENKKQISNNEDLNDDIPF